MNLGKRIQKRLSLRVTAETTVVLFRLHTDLRAIRKHLESKAKQP